MKSHLCLCLPMILACSALAQEAATPAAPAEGPPSVEAAAPPAAGSWTYAEYVRVMEATNRKPNISENTFNNVQNNKEKALETIRKYLEGKFSEADEDVIRAFATVPREYFHYNHEGRYSTAGSAYEAQAKPWGIGYGSVLSDYLGQAYMTQLSEPDADDVVLEIGTGSGFQSSLLSRIVREVYTIEIIEPLGNAVKNAIEALGYSNVHPRVGDGFYGWPEVEGGFDIIMVTCAARYVPPALIEQLKPDGKLLIPVGPPIRGKQVLFVYTKDAEGKVHSRRDVGVHFIPMTGELLKQDRPK